MDYLRFPTGQGALEVASVIGVDPDSIDFTCQDWEYTFPDVVMLSAFVDTYKIRALSDLAKRVLGCRRSRVDTRSPECRPNIPSKGRVASSCCAESTGVLIGDSSTESAAFNVLGGLRLPIYFRSLDVSR